eukprot:Skav229013  [mRNA]  locus=scaffold127:451993:453258:- [translate_table: standard]
MALSCHAAIVSQHCLALAALPFRPCIFCRGVTLQCSHAPAMFRCCSEQKVSKTLESELQVATGKAKREYDPALVYLPASFEVDGTAPLREPPLKSGPVWFLQTKHHDGPLQEASKVVLSIHLNGMRIRYGEDRLSRSLAWSPFTVVQANRFHAKETDEHWSHLRLFKVADFQNGVSCLFMVVGRGSDEARQERASWVATASCAIRMLTLSLFPRSNVQTMPNGLLWTQTRVLAGHMLLFDLRGVTPVFCELHAPVDYTTNLMAYEDDSCTCLLTTLIIDCDTRITERLGVDSSCFTLNEHHFSARTVAEKTCWIRAISNIKVKLRHASLPTSDLELSYYRSAVEEHIACLPSPRLPGKILQEAYDAPLLKRRVQPSPMTYPGNPGVQSTLHAPRTPSVCSEKSLESPTTPPASAHVVAVAV